MALKVAFKVEDKCTTLLLSGDLNEHSSALDSITVNPDFDLHIDIQGLGALNSLGVRNFSKWINSVQCSHLRFFYCPRNFITQLNLIKNFIPLKSEIESFFVPYFSEALGEEQRVLFTKSLDYRKENGKVVLNFPEVLDSQGNPMDLDVFKDQYFRFLDIYY